ncbi:MAG: hypothetical protein US69_C0002G0007 [candidate division TM6 bacterium GW2011_GWF2_38_10]|nr:MAG: hypothetical protein US69_C0002G0007 [candidate division TM6 bacterium GW2011_GWF2_38_10]
MMTIRYFLAIGLLFLGVHCAEGSITKDHADQAAKRFDDFLQKQSPSMIKYLKPLIENMPLNAKVYNETGTQVIYKVKDSLDCSTRQKVTDSFVNACWNYCKNNKYCVFGIAASIAVLYFIAKVATDDTFDEVQAYDNSAVDDESEVL